MPFRATVFTWQILFQFNKHIRRVLLEVHAIVHDLCAQMFALNGELDEKKVYSNNPLHTMYSKRPKQVKTECRSIQTLFHAHFE